MCSDTASPAIARRLVAEDAVVTSNLASGLLLAVMALGPADRRPCVLVQRGHVVRIAGVGLDTLLQLIRSTLIEAGTVEECSVGEFETDVSGCDLALYVVSTATVGDMVDLPQFVWTAHAAGRPALVLDPVSGNWTAWLDAGADLVVLDAAALSGATGGIVAGEGNRIEKCRQLLLGSALPFAADQAQVAHIAASMSNWKPPQEPRIEAAAFHATVAA